MASVPVARCWWRRFAVAAHADVTHVDLSPDALRETAALGWLDATEQQRLRRFVAARPRRDFALCRAALRALLCGHLDCENAQLSFGDSDRGKPFALVDAAPAAIDFNISHSGAHALIAVTRAGRVGIDVEDRALRRNIDAAAALTFAAAELAELAAAGEACRTRLFYRIWTMKEALIKALGTGFTTDPSQFEVPPALRQGARRTTWRFPQLSAAQWQLENLGNADFAAAVATELRPTHHGRTP